MRAWLCALLCLAAGPVLAQEAERETFSLLGWNDGCSVAVRQYGYPHLGAAIQEEPVAARIGTLTIPPGEQAAKAAWSVDWQGAGSWDKGEVLRAIQELRQAGYQHPGYPEDIVLPRQGTHTYEQAILSTATFGLRADFPALGEDWRWVRVTYSPLGDCGLFLFTRDRGGRVFYRVQLMRFFNPAVRKQRAEAHLSNSRLLYEASDLDGALAEAATAAAMRPELASGRYRHAVLLCLSGHLNESVAELGEAVRLDRGLAAKAKDDPDFSEVSGFPRFRSLVGEEP